MGRDRKYDIRTALRRDELREDIAKVIEMMKEANSFEVRLSLKKLSEKLEHELRITKGDK